MGEIGHKYLGSGLPLNETWQRQSTRKIMDEALANGYIGCFLWRYSAMGDNHRMLKLASSDPGSTMTSRLSFLQLFQTQANRTGLERPIWNEIRAFITAHNHVGASPIVNP